MKKSLLILAFASSVALADEGMWMPQQLPDIADELKAAGLELDPANLTKLTEFPMAAIVSLGGCSASFISPNGLVVTNHHCVYNSIAHNSTPDNDLLANGFLAANMTDEVPAAPGSRVYVTKAVDNVTAQVIDDKTAKLSGKQRIDAIETNQKQLIAQCEQDEGHRCRVAAYYGSLEYYLIKQLEIKDVRLVHAPAEGVGKFGGDTDNWMWPRHTGDYGFLRAYVSPEGKSADYHVDNVPYQPDHYLKLAAEGLQEGDFVMALGYPGRTNRHRLPSEVSETFEWSYPNTVQQFKDTLAIIDRVTSTNKDAELKYASRVAGLNNYMKNRQGMLDSFAQSDFLARKQAEHKALNAWVNSSRDNKKAYAKDLTTIDKLLAEQHRKARADYALNNATPRLLNVARSLYRLAQESTKPDTERKAGYQLRDIPRFKAYVAGMERNFDVSVEKALDLHNLTKYVALPKQQRNADFDNALGIKSKMSQSELMALIDSWYAKTGLTELTNRTALIESEPAQFSQSADPFVMAAVALYKSDLKQEAEEEQLAGKIQQAYASYMRAKMAFMQSKGQAVYPDANSTLRVTYGNVKGRAHGNEDGNAWAPFTTLRGITAKATGEGEFNAPAEQLAAINAKNYGPYLVPALNSVPVNYLATLDITGGNSGSAVLNSKAEFVGLAFDGTLDSIISDWDYNPANTRSIQVDLRFMLWQMQQVDNATALLKEIGVN
ncbi:MULTISPECIES: S46 family peptidase [unclassified Arsukibacterium]|uniref:S46 family peptidase n=1 Tax=unclassified Arsukibacterium TaxID=2635278 RepID=UPI000C3B09FD|nr:MULTISPECIES: S46 family peptidase [unclassified Arsukibacterium]MAA93350.1 dipeptidyl-peptidase 7 [Rheinheimera sp.]MBM35292.1 dipeptidyl-peptidase 7 [Rheinheimera sp.]HAW91890.1 dipeptidyl-peptidase 7 [Candidatus Azambacteria bacterium]|tara:strand:+ start:45832 stop:47988 length:2157 start_codon:yes stop_codon:yes gene_type:complete